MCPSARSFIRRCRRRRSIDCSVQAFDTQIDLIVGIIKATISLW